MVFLKKPGPFLGVILPVILLAATVLCAWASVVALLHDNAMKQARIESLVSVSAISRQDFNLRRIDVHVGQRRLEPCRAATFWAPDRAGDIDRAMAKSLVLDFGWKLSKGPSCANAAIAIGASARSCHKAFRIGVEVKRQRKFIPSASSMFSGIRNNEALRSFTLQPPFDTKVNLWILQDECLLEGHLNYNRRVVGQISKTFLEEKLVLLNAFTSNKEMKHSDSKPFFPKSFRLDDAVQREAFGRLIPCKGQNDQWLVKSSAHGGRGIEVLQTYEAIRKLHLADVAGCGDNRTRERVKVNRPQTPESISHHERRMDVAFAQEIVKPVHWSKGQRFMIRAFCALVRDGDVDLVVDGVQASVDIDRRAAYHLWIMNDPYAIVHKGVVSDDDPKNTIHFKEDLNAAIQEKFGHMAWVDKVMLPRMAEIALASLQSLQAYLGEGLDVSVERVWAAEPPGSYLFLAFDFLLSPSLDLFVIDVTTSGISMRQELRNRYGIQMARLLLAVMQGAGGPNNGFRIPNWTFVAQLPALPHP